MLKIALAAAIAALTLSAMPAYAASGCGGGGWTYCSKYMHGAGLCDGADQVPILQPAWEPFSIEILSVTVALRTGLGLGWAYAFAGNNDDPDVMLFQAGAGSTTKQFKPGHAFTLRPAGPNAPHVDLHISCSTIQPTPLEPPPPISWWRHPLALGRAIGHHFAQRRLGATAKPPSQMQKATPVKTPYEAWLVIDYEPKR
jgi:hypothetical protein